MEWWFIALSIIVYNGGKKKGKKSKIQFRVQACFKFGNFTFNSFIFPQDQFAVLCYRGTAAAGAAALLEYNCFRSGAVHGVDDVPYMLIRYLKILRRDPQTSFIPDRSKQGNNRGRKERFSRAIDP